MAWFGKSNKSSAAQRGKQQVESGLVIFYSVEDAIMAERILNKNDIRCRLVAPPRSCARVVIWPWRSI